MDYGAAAAEGDTAKQSSVSARVLYVTYDGLTDPLGRSQILPYLTALSARGHHIAIVSCEKADRLANDGELVGTICSDAGIGWHPLRYHKRPPILSTLWDLGKMLLKAAELQRSASFDLVHCRSYLPAIVGQHMKHRFGAKFLFDMRAFWADERADSGQWRIDRFPYRQVYGYLKQKESEFFRQADHIVSLTEAGRRVMLERREFEAGGPPVSVIPCCADFEFFAPVSPSSRSRARALLGIADDAKVAVFLGSLGGLSMLEEMLHFFSVYSRREPHAHLLLITPDSPEPIIAAARQFRLAPQSLTIRAASREQVPSFAAAADFGLFFVRPVPSKKAGSPTKMGELLALGLPIVANAGVGDVEDLCTELRAGTVVKNFTEEAYEAALDALAALPRDPEGIRERAKARLDLAIAVAGYDRIYRALASVLPA